MFSRLFSLFHFPQHFLTVSKKYTRSTRKSHHSGMYHCDNTAPRHVGSQELCINSSSISNTLSPFLGLSLPSQVYMGLLELVPTIQLALSSVVRAYNQANIPLPKRDLWDLKLPIGYITLCALFVAPCWCYVRDT